MNYYEFNDKKCTQYPLVEFDYEPMMVEYEDLSDDEIVVFHKLLESVYAPKRDGDGVRQEGEPSECREE